MRIAALLAIAALGATGCDPEAPASSDGKTLADAATDARADAGPAPTDGATTPDAPGDASSLGDTTADSVPDVWVEVCNVTNWLALRAGPGTTHAILAQLPSGTRLRLLGKNGDWWNVDFNGQIGWSHSSYLCPAAAPSTDGGATDGGPGGNDGGGTIGAYIGLMWNTYYYLANENDYGGTKNTTLYDSNCSAIAVVSASYSDAVCIEGSGKLTNGDVINYARSCSCGRACPTGGIVCYKKLGASFPWGEGAYGNALEPFRSIAVDKSFIALKRVIYLKEWDGVAIPKVGSIGGFVHDGCFRADDLGGAIKGNHYDFFSGTRAMYLALDKLFKTKSNFGAYDGGSRCAYLKKP